MQYKVEHICLKIFTCTYACGVLQRKLPYVQKYFQYILKILNVYIGVFIFIQYRISANVIIIHVGMRKIEGCGQKLRHYIYINARIAARFSPQSR